MMINGGQRRQLRRIAVAGVAVILAPLVSPARPAAAEPRFTLDNPTFTAPAAFDRTVPLRDVVRARASARGSVDAAGPRVGDMRPDDGPTVANRPYAGDPSVQRHKPRPVIPGTKANFEGLSNQDNFNVLGIRVNPPDPVGDVGPNHYVEMINLVFGVYSKTGTLMLGPVDTGTLWAGFPIDECTDVHHRLQLPRLPEVWRLGRLVPDHHPRVRHRRSVDLRHRCLRPGTGKDDRR
jgi:hypothetical protein